MNGSQAPMGKRKSDEDVFSAVLGFLVLGIACLGFWWWQIGDAARMQLLGAIAEGSGYPPPPRDMIEQVEWLATNRMNDLFNMFLLFALTATAGIMEGNSKRQAEILSGFGLMRLKAARVLVLVWLGLVACSVAAPVALPYGIVGAVLAGMLGIAMYNIGRGFRRVH